MHSVVNGATASFTAGLGSAGATTIQTCGATVAALTECSRRFRLERVKRARARQEWFPVLPTVTVTVT